MTKTGSLIYMGAKQYNAVFVKYKNASESSRRLFKTQISRPYAPAPELLIQ